jgi:hypothetical protein
MTRLLALESLGYVFRGVNLLLESTATLGQRVEHATKGTPGQQRLIVDEVRVDDADRLGGGDALRGPLVPVVVGMTSLWGRSQGAWLC